MVFIFNQTICEQFFLGPTGHQKKMETKRHPEPSLKPTFLLTFEGCGTLTPLRGTFLYRRLTIHSLLFEPERVKALISAERVRKLVCRVFKPNGCDIFVLKNMPRSQGISRRLFQPTQTARLARPPRYRARRASLFSSSSSSRMKSSESPIKMRTEGRV